jgi:hypothetical protein
MPNPDHWNSYSAEEVREHVDLGDDLVNVRQGFTLRRGTREVLHVYDHEAGLRGVQDEEIFWPNPMLPRCQHAENGEYYQNKSYFYFNNPPMFLFLAYLKMNFFIGHYAVGYWGEASLHIYSDSKSLGYNEIWRQGSPSICSSDRKSSPMHQSHLSKGEWQVVGLNTSFI